MDGVRPLSERVLGRLPGSSWSWVCVWALVPWINALVNLSLDEESRSAVWDEGATFVVLSYSTLSLAMVVTLLGASELAGRIGRFRAAGAGVLEGADTGPRRFAVAGPLAGALLMALAFGGSTLVADAGWWPALVRALTWFVLGVAIWSFLWTYGALQFALDRLGRAHLRAEMVNVAPDLGLRPFGDAAFLGLWLLLAWLVPVVWTGLSDVVGFVIGMLALGLSRGLRRHLPRKRARLPKRALRRGRHR